MQIVEDMIIAGRKDVTGQLVGVVRVLAGGYLVQHGQITGGLVIEEGGEAVVHGQIVNDVINHGTLTLLGQITGRLVGNPPINSVTREQIVGTSSS